MNASLPNLPPLGRRIPATPRNPYTTGLQIDLDAAHCGIFSDGVSMALWPDQSGNGNDSGQSTAGFRPVLKLNVVNGRPAVKFDGSNDRLTNTAFTGIGAGDFTAFLVSKSLLLSSDAVCWSMGTNTTNLGMQLGIAGSDNDGTWGFSKVGTAILNTTAPGAAAAWNVTRIQRSTTSLKLYVNGQPTSPASSTPGTMNIGLGYQIGSDLANGEPWNGYVARWLFYNASLTDPQAQPIEDYLGHLAGVTITH